MDESGSRARAEAYVRPSPLHFCFYIKSRYGSSSYPMPGAYTRYILRLVYFVQGAGGSGNRNNFDKENVARIFGASADVISWHWWGRLESCAFTLTLLFLTLVSGLWGPSLVSKWPPPYYKWPQRKRIECWVCLFFLPFPIFFFPKLCRITTVLFLLAVQPWRNKTFDSISLMQLSIIRLARNGFDANSP